MDPPPTPTPGVRQQLPGGQGGPGRGHGAGGREGGHGRDGAGRAQHAHHPQRALQRARHLPAAVLHVAQRHRGRPRPAVGEEPLHTRAVQDAHQDPAHRGHHDRGAERPQHVQVERAGRRHFLTRLGFWLV